MTTATGTCAACPMPLAASAQRPRRFAVRLADMVICWMERARERRMLASLDDRMMHDIGIDRTDLQAEAVKPFWRT